MKKKAEENWDSGVLLLREGKPNAAASRFYYAIFQASREYAQIYLSYIPPGESGDHQGLLDYLNAKYASGAERTELTRIFRALKAKRITADYKKEKIVRQDLIPYIDPGKKLLSQIL